VYENEDSDAVFRPTDPYSPESTELILVVIMWCSLSSLFQYWWKMSCCRYPPVSAVVSTATSLCSMCPVKRNVLHRINAKKLKPLTTSCLEMERAYSYFDASEICPKWTILCRVGCKALTQSIHVSMIKSHIWNMFTCNRAWELQISDF